MNTRSLVFVMVLGLGSWFSGCEIEGGDDPDSSSDFVSDSSNPTSATMTFTAAGVSPKTVSIRSGGTVTFVNQDTRAHLLNFGGDNIADVDLPVSASRTVTFSFAGGFSFICEYTSGNPAFGGNVVVQ